MEDKETVMKRIKRLSTEELQYYIKKLYVYDDDLLNDNEFLFEVAKRVPKHSYYYRIVRDKLAPKGININEELERINREETLDFMNSNHDLQETLDIVTGWWIEAIKKPFFRNFNLKSVPIEEGMYIHFPYNKDKVEAKNAENLTEEKIEIFKTALAFEIADKIRKEGQCKLWVDNHACWEINKCIDAADLRFKVDLPAKVNMIITPNTIKMLDSMNSWKVVYDNSKEEENTAGKKM